MTKITTEYMGDMHCASTHIPSGAIIGTDAPIDFGGRGKFFTPVDLLAASLTSLMATIAGLHAQRNKIELKGMIIEAETILATDQERRLARIDVRVKMPFNPTDEERQILENQMRRCPATLGLDPNIEMSITFYWPV